MGTSFSRGPLVPPSMGSMGSANYASDGHCRLFPAPTKGAKLYQGGLGVPKSRELAPPRQQSYTVLLPPASSGQPAARRQNQAHYEF